MTHEGAVEKIVDLLHGRLADIERDDTVAHVRGCAECGELAATYATLSAAFDDDGAAGEHPPGALIVSYALREQGLAAHERDWVASHVLQCNACAAEVETIGEAEAEAARDSATPAGAEPPSRRARSAAYAPAFAAAAVLLLLAYPAYLGLFEVPRIHERIATLEASRSAAPAPETWDGGPVHQRVLAAPLRGTTGEPTVIPLAEGQPYVMLEVDPGSLEEFATGVTRFGVLDGTGASLWSRELTADQIRSYVRSTGTLEFVVPAAALGSGPLTLAVSRGSERLFEASFLVEPETRR
jgi:hypothetical protein